MLKIDAGIPDILADVPEQAAKLERLGYDGLACAETAHDPFMPLALAAEHTSRVELMTSIAVGFARNPMVLANLAHDLNAYSKGRFSLGIGSQIKPHITKRFSMEWSDPAARMKEMIQAIHAIWDCWYDGTPLKFRGDYYQHTLMTPLFTPKDIDHGRAKILLAAVGPLMTRTAAEVADGLLIHAFTTPRYLKEVTAPVVEETLSQSGRARGDFQMVYPAFIVTGETEEQFEKWKKITRERIAFYGSTPAYKGVLDLHGWGDVQPELNRLSKEGKWVEMGTLIEDDILDAFAVVGEPDVVIGKLKERFEGVVDRLFVSFPDLPEDRVGQLIDQMKAA
ncbi:MAG: TIGR03617 family F420-dependent LLM class oxidoreductase [Alphaproteobacteria bacterium]